MDGVKFIIKLPGDPARFLWLVLRPRSPLAAENLILRRHMAMFQERGAIPCDHRYRLLIHDRDGIFSPGPGMPEPPADLPVAPQTHRYRIPGLFKVTSHSVPGGLHHEYGLLQMAA
jgi:hypothetical protein